MSNDKFKIERIHTSLEVSQHGGSFYVLSESKAANSTRRHSMTLAEASKLHKWLGARLIEVASGNRTSFSDMIKDGTLEPLRKPTTKRNSGIKWQVTCDPYTVYVTGSLEEKRFSAAVSKVGTLVVKDSTFKLAIQRITQTLLNKWY